MANNPWDDPAIDLRVVRAATGYHSDPPTAWPQSDQDMAEYREALFIYWGWSEDEPPSPGRIADRLTDIELLRPDDAEAAAVKLSLLRASLDAWAMRPGLASEGFCMETGPWKSRREYP